MAKRTQAARHKAQATVKEPFVFISYRRADSAAAARWLYSAIQRTFGPDHVFMDTEAIRVSSEWPKAILNGLQRATHLIAVVGPYWLRVTDDYGRRRIDRDDDWVHTEIAHALQKSKRILPIVLGKDAMPRAEALPRDIQKLGFIQPFELRDDRWESDLNLLLKELEKQGFRRATVSPVRYPTPRVSITEIPHAELASILQSLPGWTEVVSPLPGQEPLERIELRKAFEFGSFRSAIEFMREVSEPVEKVQHHPRWENIWRTVTVCLSTWDIGHKPSQLDIDLAREIERIYKRYSSDRKAKAKSRQPRDLT